MCSYGRRRTGCRVGEWHSRTERGIEGRIGRHRAGEAKCAAEELSCTGIDGVEAAGCFASFMPIDEYIDGKGTVPRVHGLAERVRGGKSDRIGTGGHREQTFTGVWRDRGSDVVEARATVDNNQVEGA